MAGVWKREWQSLFPQTGGDSRMPLRNAATSTLTTGRDRTVQDSTIAVIPTSGGDSGAQHNGDADSQVTPSLSPADAMRVRLRKRIRRMYPVAALLFIATCASTWSVGGPTYAMAVMGILLAHELGHYIQTLLHRVPASPPLFIPMPFVPFGTMGAVIVQGSGFADRRALFDIAISGPLAGLIVALPVAWYGLQTSEIVEVTPDTSAMIWGDPMILEWLIELKHGPLAENQEVAFNPLLFAGWVGIFITALNLMPIGQLDGGHIMYTLIGRHAHLVANGVIIGAFVWMIYTLDIAYALMVGLLIMFGTRHPPTANDSARIGPVRAVLGVLTLAFVVIGFTPTPLTIHQPEPQTIEMPADAVAV